MRPAYSWIDLLLFAVAAAIVVPLVIDLAELIMEQISQ